MLDWLQSARIELENAGLAPSLLAPTVRALRRAQARLSRPTRLAIAGESNSGKTSLANLLAGIESLPTSVLSNTRLPTLLRYSSSPAIIGNYSDGRRSELDVAADASASLASLEVCLPAPRLAAIEIVDLPGLDHLSAGGWQDAVAFVPEGIIWCTPATQAWRATEQMAWTMMPEHLRRRSLLAVTFADLLAVPDQRARVLQRLERDISPPFGKILPVSSLEWRRAQLAADAGGRVHRAAASGMSELMTAAEALAERALLERMERARTFTARIATHALARLDDTAFSERC